MSSLVLDALEVEPLSCLWNPLLYVNFSFHGHKIRIISLRELWKRRWCGEQGTNRMPIRTDTPQTVSVMSIPIADYREIVPVSSINPSSSGRLQISYDGSKVSKMQNGHAGGCWSWGFVGLSPLLPGFPGCCGFRLRNKTYSLSCGFSSDFWSNSGWDQSSIKIILDNEIGQFPLKSSVLSVCLSVCCGKPLEVHTLEKGKTCLLIASEFSVSGCLTPLLSLVRRNIMAGGLSLSFGLCFCPMTWSDATFKYCVAFYSTLYLLANKTCPLSSPLTSVRIGPGLFPYW